MKLAEKLLKHLVPFWWGQPGTTPGNGIHGDERILSSMPLNQWEKWEVGTAALLLLPLFTCLNNYSDGYINSIWHQSQRATRHWKRLLVEVCEAPSSEVLMSRLAGIRKGVSQQSTGLQTIWPKQHFVPSPRNIFGLLSNSSFAKHSSFQISPHPFIHSQHGLVCGHRAARGWTENCAHKPWGPHHLVYNTNLVALTYFRSKPAAFAQLR